MKKQITLLLVLFLIIPFYISASDGLQINKKEKAILLSPQYSINPSESDYDLSLMNLQVDLMGVVFFGPQVALDFQFANIIAVGPFFRWNYAGVLYQGVITEWFTDESTPSPASYGIGLQAKALIPVGSGKHRPYAGFSYERFRGKETYGQSGESGDHIWEYKSNILLVNLGYRMLTESSFNLSMGLSLGISNETENIDYYEFEEDYIDYNFTNTRFIGMLQICIGWQLGK